MFARPGENVSIKLIHIDEESMINKGDVITSRDSPMPVTTVIEADIKLFKLLDHKQVFTKGYTCVMHLHTIMVDCTVTELISLQVKEKASGQKEAKMWPKFIKSYTYCRVRIETTNPIAVEKYDSIPYFARFTLRDEGKTIAAGKILKYKPLNASPILKVILQGDVTAKISKVSKAEG